MVPVTTPGAGQTRTLASLLAELAGARLLRGDPDTVITSVEHDSRSVAAGSLFVAVPGFTVDGHDFLAPAANAGAAAAVVQAGHSRPGLPPGLALVEVADTREALGDAAAWAYGHPGREMTVIGITGTDGKTTTSHLLTSVLEASGARAGRLGHRRYVLPRRIRRRWRAHDDA